MKRSSVRLPLGTRARDNAQLMIESAITTPHTHRVTLLIAIVGVLVASYALWRNDNVRDREDATRERVQALESANSLLHTELAASVERESQARTDLQKQWQSLAELPQKFRDLATAQEELRARTERPQRAWSRAEAIYLVELAQRRLSFDRDLPTAIVALELADTRLASLHDSSLQPVRERIARDLQALRASPDPDRTGLIARLSAIETQIDQLPLNGTLVGKRSDDAPSDGTQSSFERVWRSMVATLDRMISVRRIKDSHSEIVTLEEQSLRRQHLSLLLYTAKQAVTRSDQVSFKSTLTEMQSWLAQYFAASPTVDAAHQDITAMLAVDIAPPLPDISVATQLLLRNAPPSQ
jgi:uroporphyrin-3 C-methyltransferase